MTTHSKTEHQQTIGSKTLDIGRTHKTSRGILKTLLFQAAVWFKINHLCVHRQTGLFVLLVLLSFSSQVSTSKTTRHLRHTLSLRFAAREATCAFAHSRSARNCPIYTAHHTNFPVILPVLFWTLCHINVCTFYKLL